MQAATQALLGVRSPAIVLEKQRHSARKLFQGASLQHLCDRGPADGGTDAGL